jgi:hypothetical protein
MLPSKGPVGRQECEHAPAVHGRVMKGITFLCCNCSSMLLACYVAFYCSVPFEAWVYVNMCACFAYNHGMAAGSARRIL